MRAAIGRLGQNLQDINQTQDGTNGTVATGIRIIAPAGMPREKPRPRISREIGSLSGKATDPATGRRKGLLSMAAHRLDQQNRSMAGYASRTLITDG